MPTLATKTPVVEIPPADAVSARAHFDSLLRFETDCWDVHESLASAEPGFVLLDVRSPQAFAKGHVAGAINIPHRVLSPRTLAEYPAETIFVAYCDGPHCNGADKASARLAALGRPVKKMIGGIEGWKDEGFSLAT